MGSSGLVRWGAMGLMLGGGVWVVLGLSALSGFLGEGCRAAVSAREVNRRKRTSRALGRIAPKDMPFGRRVAPFLA
jgi:hypothetical protein